MAWLDVSLCVIISILVLVTIRCLIKVMERSPSLSSISLGYCIVVVLIIIRDMGFNCLMLKYSLIPEE
ncbi:hypothetical protein Y032_0006g3122 [Ancylostoma ceylanicum]|nr:hypothetical protein Y032_0006g3122 [Ancylostoma ceylanicum]